jgi:hypothetical protein
VAYQRVKPTYKTLHVSGIFSAHHEEFSTAHLALASSMKVFDDRFQAVRMELFHPDSKTCVELMNAKCTVENS